MKKIFSVIAFSAIVIACNNSADTSTTTTTPSDTDTMSKTVTPPPVTLDTPSNVSDSAKVKKAMKK